MADQLDPFDFMLAEAIGGTVAENNERISNQEYVMWRAYFVFKGEMTKFANQENSGKESVTFD